MRPIKSNQWLIDVYEIASLSTSGSVFSGRKKSGGLLRRVSPKKAGGAIPTTVNGLSLRLKTLPMTDGSDPYFLLP